MGQIADVPCLPCLLFFFLWAADTCFRLDGRRKKENTYALRTVWCYRNALGNCSEIYTVLKLTVLLHSTPGVRKYTSHPRTIKPLCDVSHSSLHQLTDCCMAFRDFFLTQYKQLQKQYFRTFIPLYGAVICGAISINRVTRNTV